MIDVRIHSKDKIELLTNQGIEEYGFRITVYAGFIWDGASIPRILWEELGCPFNYLMPSLFHDALYRTHLLDRKTADKIFHRLLSKAGVDMVTAKALYLGVRVGGQTSWDDNFAMLSHYRNYVKIELIGREKW